MPENRFDESVAARYKKLWPELFEPAVVDQAVSFLTDLAGSARSSSWASVRVASRRSHISVWEKPGYLGGSDRA